MSNHNTIYQQEAARYDALVMREDKDGHLLPAIEKHRTLSGIDVVESGAGTGRLTAQIAPLARSVKAFDLSAHMLGTATAKLQSLGLDNWHTNVADHRDIPLPDNCADLVISGWSVCYLNNKQREDWQTPFLDAVAEFKRLLRPDGSLIIIETEGTGVTAPNPPDSMHNYLGLLKELDFQWEWIRTDYCFTSWHEVHELVPFFFGEAMLGACYTGECGVILPECTGIWHWKE